MHIASESHVLVPSEPRHAVGILAAVDKALASCRARDLRWRMTVMRTWHILPRPGVRGIAIKHRRLREWTVCVTANPEGSFIAVAWYLVAKPSWRGDLRRLLRIRSSAHERQTVGSELNFQRRAALNNFGAITRHALQQAIDACGKKVRTYGQVGNQHQPRSGWR
jgi:hypothetical protein